MARKVGETMSLGGLAAELGVSERSIQELAAEGVVVRAARGRYLRSESVTRYCAHLRERQAPSSYTDARARKTQAEASLREMELAKARGDLISVDDSFAVLKAELETINASLRSAKARLGPALGRRLGLTGGEGMRIVEDVVEQARADLLRAFEKLHADSDD